MNVQLINEIVDIDKNLMGNGILKFDPERRRNGLRRELKDGAKIIQHRSNGELKGYIEFLPLDGNRIYIVSFQNSGSFIPRNFICEVFGYLSSKTELVLNSSVHKNNLKSIKFHKKIGFVESESDTRVYFEVRIENLLAKIKGLTRPVCS
jgi:hypothetical protein